VEKAGCALLVRIKTDRFFMNNTLPPPANFLKQMSRIKLLGSNKFLWLVIFALALFLRLIELGHQSLWYDEILTLKVSQTSGQDFLKALEIESNKPPLYFLLMHGWLRWGATEFWLRLPSAIFGALSCVMALILGREVLGRSYGWILGLVLAVLPFDVYYSQEARMYALLVLMGVCAMLFSCLFCRTQQLRYALSYLICATLACYTFTYGIFLMPFSCLLSLAFRPRLPRKALITLWTANFVVALLFSPWVPRLLNSIHTGTGLNPLVRASAIQTSAYAFFTLGLGTTFGPSTEQLRVWGRHIFAEQPGTGGLFIAGLLIEVAIVVIGLRKLWQSNRNGFFFAVIGLGIFGGIPAAINMLKPEIPNNPRYTILAIVPFAVIITGFVMWTLEPGKGRKILAAVFAALVGISLANNFFNPQYAREDIRSAARFLESLQSPPSNLVVCADFMKVPLQHYYDGPAQILPLSIQRQPVEEALKPFASALNEQGLFGLVYARPDYGDPQGVLPAWLKQHYHLELEKKWTGVTVYLFDAEKP
jgi:4-amino-4-deoxy-L-arabinose transferase-like glycosyltransferase